MLRGDVLVLEVAGFFESLFQQLVDLVRHRGLRSFSGNLRQLVDIAVDLAQDGLRTDANLFEHRWNDAFFVFEQRCQQMNWQQLRIAMLGSELAGALYSFLRFNSKFVPTYGHDETSIQQLRDLVIESLEGNSGARGSNYPMTKSNNHKTNREAVTSAASLGKPSSVARLDSRGRLSPHISIPALCGFAGAFA